MYKPTAIPQGEYEVMPTFEKRFLPTEQDRIINKENMPQLCLPFNQVEYKTPKHGEIYGLTINENNKASRADAPILINELEAQASNPKTQWKLDGKYQDQPSINLYDPQKDIITVYKKVNEENLFLTTLQMSAREAQHFRATNGDFVSEKILTNPDALSTFNANNNN